MSRLRVYVAGPITKGDMARNLRAPMAAADRLIAAGFAPFVPHLYFHMQLAFPQDYETWMEIDKSYVLSTHAVLRVPGESSGADREMAWARAALIPVFDSVDALIAHFTVPKL